MKKLLTLVLFAALALTAAAAPVKNMPAVRLQPNGDTLRCLVSGDEFFHRLHDADGYTIVQDTKTGWYLYAALSADGTLVPTTLRPGLDNPAKAGLRPGLMPSAKELCRLRARFDIPAEYQEPQAKTRSFAVSRMNNIVIFVRFSDEAALGTEPFATYNAMFNDSTPGATSMYSYFRRASYGTLSIPTYFYPTPSGSTVLSYQDTLPRAYYMPRTATNLIGYDDDDDDDRRDREFTLIQSAVNWLNANYTIPSSIDLDCDGDGKIDNITFVVSGTYTGWSDLLWPHKWSLYNRNVYINNKRVYTFNLQLAGSGSHYFSVSTFCHEMTHSLGAPDLYHYGDYGSVSPAGSWDLMCSNGTPPQATNSLFRYKYMGWFDSIPLITDSGTYTMTSIMSGPNHAYKIASANAHEWYILEYRNNADTGDLCIPGRGMLIWRYRDNAPSNADFDFFSNKHELWLFRPNSTVDTIDGQPAQAAFGVNGRTSFTSASNPHPYLCDGTPDTSFSITNITISPDHSYVTFTFVPRGGTACPSVAPIPMAMDFEDGSVGCWHAISATSANDSRTGVYQYVNSINPHGGNYQYRFSSYTQTTDYRQWLISPRIQNAGPMHLQFYYHRTSTSSSYPERFRVLYSTTTDDTSAFTHQVADITVTSNTWDPCHVLIPAAARHVSIQYCSMDKYYLLIDDILLTDTVLAPHDTTYITVYDTLPRYIYDTVYTSVHDTFYFTFVDTLVRYNYLDTVIRTPDLYSLVVSSNATGRGRVSGSGTFPQGTRVEIAALPKPGYAFTRWQDNNTDNPRTITLLDNTAYTAYFDRSSAAPLPKDNDIIHDTIIVHDTVWVDTYDTIHITIHLDTVILPSDTRDTVWLDRDTTFYLDTTTHYRLTLDIQNDYEAGIHNFVAGSGDFPLGTEVSIGAFEAHGYVFSHWSDDATQNPRTVTVTGDMTLTAYYDLVGIDKPDGAPMAIVYSRDSRIYISGASNHPVTIYDALGRQVWASREAQLSTLNSQLSTPVLPSGLYLVQIANTTHKVIVR